MENVKEILEKFYKRVNPDNIEYSLNKTQDANKIIEIRNALYEEANKYQKILDELVMKEDNVDIYMNQYVCISNEKDFVCMYVNKIDRLNYSVRFHGPAFESCLMWTSVLPKSAVEVYYKDMKTRVRIITKEEFYKAIDDAVAFNKVWLERWLESNSRVLENKETANVME